MNTRKLAALAAAALLSVTAATGASAQGRVTIATNPQGSLYYSVGGGMAAALQEALQRQVTVQPYAGSTVYLPLVAAGEATVGINSSLDTGAIYRGDYGTDPQTDLRMLARLWPLRVSMVTRANDDLHEVSDLAGKRVVTDFSALKSVGLVNQAILKAGGIELDQVDNVTVSGLGPGMEGLTEGNLDATGIAIGIPLTQQAHATIPGGIRYLSITGDSATTEYIDGVYPGTYLVTVNPAPNLPEVTEPFTTVAYDVFLTTSAKLSDEEATSILEALYEAFPALQEDYPPIRGGDREAFANPSNTVPFHPAAVAFYKDKGMWSEDNDMHDASLSE
ncbi:TAXI family TRAP transporter solute-binding subunit [Pseudoruegeria sp. HB172150]|uniref:TAXI family TRAP transporter solute-binding subunit n=1 Tax=Pseudoruegeria sp. HB172150 TaxID=2721164 RepID=UPI001555ACF5|nr:TAXI family TRAP transporter solute-binding subunit [Pseudoruegeria sp. HB172150]